MAAPRPVPNGGTFDDSGWGPWTFKADVTELTLDEQARPAPGTRRTTPAGHNNSGEEASRTAAAADKVKYGFPVS